MIKLDSKILYFGSCNPNIKEIYKGKFLTTFKSIACCFAIDLNDVYQENKRYYSINWGYDQWNKSEKYLNKQLIPDLIKITNNAIDWIPTSGKSIGYLYSINVDDYLLEHIETFHESDPKWEVIYNGEKSLPVTLIECVELNWTCGYSKIKSDRCGFALETPVYERPWTYDEIKQHYGKYVADNLSKDPCHKWRMETGIELIHKEPDLDEQKRIWKNWQLMSDEDKQISDEKCIELFGMTNSRLHEFIMKNNWNNSKHLRSKFNQIYEQIMTKCENKYKLFEINRPLLPKNNFPFNNFINSLENSETHKTFNNKSFNLTPEQIEILGDAIKLSEIELSQIFEYLLSGREFEAWVTNTVEEFENSGLTIDKFNSIIENKTLFKNMVNSVDIDKQEMFIFGEICYFSSLNDKTDDRYWYLLEAMKNNNV